MASQKKLSPKLTFIFEHVPFCKKTNKSYSNCINDDKPGKNTKLLWVRLGFNSDFS